jgi:MtrB/PioB family decaheme-associated outer membrane protein
LTSRTTRDLVLSAGLKYNERDNRSPSNIYNYFNLGNAAYQGVNTPYSNKKSQFEAAADYRLTKGQNLRFAYEREGIKRWCNNTANGAECVAATSSKEDKLGLTYRFKARDDLNFSAGYSHAKRTSDLNHTYLTPIGATTALPANGINGQDRLGYVAFPYAMRKRDLLKAGVNWQATERIDLGMSGRIAKDTYPDSTLGVQDGHNTSLNLDATYRYGDNGSVGAYASWQEGERNLRAGFNGTVVLAPTSIWTNRLTDKGNAVGLTAKHRGLMGGKLELVGDLSYSFDKSRYSTQVPYLPTCGLATVLTCGDTPDIKSRLFALRLSGTYQVDKNARIAVTYLYQKLRSDDFYYNGLQFGFTPNRVVPTGEQAPNYSVNVIAASYIYTFR